MVEPLNTKATAEAFSVWWNADGRFLDPDTSDVPWFDKREALAEYAYLAASAAAESRVLSLEGALRNLAEAVDCEVDIGGKSGMFRERLTEARSALQENGNG